MRNARFIGSGDLAGAVKESGGDAAYLMRGGAVRKYFLASGKGVVVRYGEGFAPLPDGAAVRIGGKIVYEQGNNGAPQA